MSILSHRAWRWVRRTAIAIIGLVVLVYLLLNVSPVPSAMVVRYMFDKEAARVRQALEAHTPTGVASILNQEYSGGDADARLDVYFPEEIASSGKRLPTIIWIHGGGWCSGDKTDAAPYFMLLAKQGYTVISINYSLAPGHTYPTPIHQINAMLAYVQQEAERFHVDTERIVLAGDSAGAQLASQTAALITNPAFAVEVGVSPMLEPRQLRGVVLHCGVFAPALVIERSEQSSSWFLRWGIRTMIWAYTGSRDAASVPAGQMATLDHVTAAFPPAFVSGGHHDPLTDLQSRPLAVRLHELGVDVSTLFFAADHQPALGHEYQFNMDNDDGKLAFGQMVEFLQARM